MAHKMKYESVEGGGKRKRKTVFGNKNNSIKQHANE